MLDDGCCKFGKLDGQDKYSGARVRPLLIDNQRYYLILLDDCRSVILLYLNLNREQAMEP